MNLGNEKKLENIFKDILEKYEEPKKQYCIVGKNNTYKTYLLSEMSKNKNSADIKSLFINSEENIGNNINTSVVDDLEGDALIKFLTAPDNKAVTKENYLKRIFEIIVYNYPKKYYELLENFVIFEEFEGIDKVCLSDYIILSDGEFVEKKDCSSGINSLLGIIACCLYCLEKQITTIFIDEIEKHLDCDNSYRLTKFLQSHFKEITYEDSTPKKIRIIISTHSENVITALKNYNIIEYDYENEKLYKSHSNNFKDISITRNKFFSVNENIEDLNKICIDKENILFYLSILEKGEELGDGDKKNILLLKDKVENLDDFDKVNLQILLDEVN